MSSHEDAARRFAQIEGERDYYKRMAEKRESRITTLAITLAELHQAVAHYRAMHDAHGDGSVAAGQAWDRMRRAEARAREVLGASKGDQS